ncbi:MAG: paraquat-inducible protein A [Pseudomonadota bacterium]
MDVLACPTCDLLNEVPRLGPGDRARCARCNRLLVARRRNAIDRMLASGAAVTILMVAAVFLPFLSISEMGFRNAASLFDVAASFSRGINVPLTLAVAACIIFIPIARVLALYAALLPVRLGWRPAPQAARLFRLAEALKPWSMAEIFIVGTSVALVKLGGIAQVYYGPAFWAFVLLVLVIALEQAIVDRTTVWDLLDPRP